MIAVAKILPFPSKPNPRRKPCRSASGGVSFTLRVDANEIADELVNQIKRGEGSPPETD